MSKTKIPAKISNLLWAQSGGRCQYEGCNKVLYEDILTKYAYNKAYIAHIVADSEDGPRGDKDLSAKLSTDINNLMLLCDEHHRLIDKVDIEGHSVEILKNMKKKHEERIELVTSIDTNKQTNIITYTAKVGKKNTLINFARATEAIIPEWYPADKCEIDLSLNNSSFEDNDKFYWELESKNLESLFSEKVKHRFNSNNQHYSIFAIAPQPLLIKLGTLISDIYNAEVYQLHREPSTWKWQKSDDDFAYKVLHNGKQSNKVALNISLSGDIDNSRIESVLGNDISIWTLTINNADNDFLKSRKQLSKFRETFRKLLNDIKISNTSYDEIHVFPAMPVAIAVEVGRTWMPKADLNMKIYDENKDLGGFIYALDIKNGKEVSNA